MTVSDVLVEVLLGAGIRRAFTVPGESFLELLDAIGRSTIAATATRHEGGAAFMAEAYGQLTGRPALCLATRAVGAANLAIGLHTARQDSTPLVAIVGQVPRPFLGREAFQEVDLVATFGALCKAAVQLDDPSTASRLAADAVAAATSGRPGPVLIALPEDIMGEPAGGAGGNATPATPRAIPAGAATGPDAGRGEDRDARLPDDRSPATADVRRVLRRLATAHRPVVLAGAGVIRSGAVDALVEFADVFELPVIAAWRRPDVFPNESPRYLGATGVGAPATVLARLLAADVVLALGTRLSQVATFDYLVPRPGCDLLHVDVDPRLTGDREPATMALRTDAGAFLRVAVAIAHSTPPEAAVLPAEADRAARSRNLGRDRADYLAAIELPSRPASGLVDPAAVMGALGRLLPAASIVTTDAGNFAGWAARHLPIRAGGRFLGPTSGAMGYALPAAIGAALAERETTTGGSGRPTVALAGDGGFAMLMAELETAVRERLRLIALVFDNEMYGTIRMHQHITHEGRAVATGLGPLDFAGVARACGARAWTVERDADVDDALAAALDSGTVAVVHLRTDPRYLSVDRLLAT